MKNFCILIDIVLMLIIVLSAYLTRNLNITVSDFTFSVAFVVLLSGFLGFSMGYLFDLYELKQLNQQSFKHVNKAEKLAVISEENEDKVKRLEAKIETLEIALKEALKNK
ncbi:MAG: hypothetical protein PHX18_03800 [Candidatus Gastranaerophilales bacterium]|nr:hypothetical protein [Candidatus Gastranaerophilales bacterium]